MYLEMSPGDMLSALGTDAQKWAQAFRERFPAVPEDEAIGWFANAMMAQWDQTNSAITHNDTRLIEHISALVRRRDLWAELALSPNGEAESAGKLDGEGARDEP